MEHVSKSFSLKGRQSLNALNDVSFSLYPGETLGIVGESGCGKSTLARVIMGVYPNVQGKLYFHGRPLELKTRSQRLAFAEKVQMIFQDPYTALNPRMKVSDIVGENLKIQKQCRGPALQQKVYELLEAVGLQGEHAGRFPSEFSGGQRQRIGIARALALNPELLICDEPISALDVSIQSQIMNLLKSLAKNYGLSYIFIAHDLAMTYYISHRVAVMYRGHIVELAPAKLLQQAPLHPYTKLLSQAVLLPEPEGLQARGIALSGKEPTAALPQGCPFAHRCPLAEAHCAVQKPPLRDMGQAHLLACHKAN